MAITETRGRRQLKTWLEKHQRTVAWFARMIGVSSTTAHSWIAGRSRPEAHRILIFLLTGVHADAWNTTEEQTEVSDAALRIAEFHKANNETHA